ncbi:Crp/Fnr family transcriptional regulator [Desulfoluna limicola]|uniref:Crp/Fnr family transcriptional regulator n=1 Tax=Desulfoluna limicola TaxID=2810562 RepID=A0ABN6F784_9BACT|nr:Crp/Fnr family transcriptional regulator [Desulfoluna limicola]BCS97576.1 Crp/Fnr family transcriptional regulator [Desulfoluna limicola]
MDKQTARRIIDALTLDSNLNRATESSLAELAQHARILDFARGDCIFNIGDESKHVYLVETGRVVLSKETPSGKVFTFLIAMGGMPLNAVTCFMERPRFFSARVAEESTVISIPGPIFKQWVLKHPEVAAGILATLGDLLDSAYTRLLDVIDEGAESRILNALNMLSLRIGPDLPLTNNDVAELTGVSRETAARVISNLHKHGLISKSRGAIKILTTLQPDDVSTNPFFIL